MLTNALQVIFDNFGLKYVARYDLLDINLTALYTLAFNYLSFVSLFLLTCSHTTKVVSMFKIYTLIIFGCNQFLFCRNVN